MQSNRCSGFTLIELMVAITVVAIFLALAVPAFTSTINRSRLSAATNELVTSLQYARSEAIKRNARVDLCRSADQVQCGSGTDSWPGWIVVVPDGNGDGASNDPKVLQSFQLEPPIQLHSAVDGGRIGYRPDGFARAGGTARGAFLNTFFDLCIATNAPAENRRRVRVVSGERLATDPMNGAGTCQ